MRQVGVLAAAGIISLEKMTKRLGDDHLRAKKLAEGLRQNPGVVLDPGSPYTNMIYLNLADHIRDDARIVTEKMKEHGVLLDADSGRRFRLVTHYWIDDDAVEQALSAFGKVLN
jgi:threonine aldolase